MAEPDPSGVNAFKPLGDRVTGPRSSWGDRLRAQDRVHAAAWAPLNTRRQIDEGIEGGSAVTIPLAVIHACFAIAALSRSDWNGAGQHALLTGAGILAYYAVLHARSMWPSLVVLAWLLFELLLARPLFGFSLGGSYLHWIVLPLSILSVRAAWKKTRLRRAAELTP